MIVYVIDSVNIYLVGCDEPAAIFMDERILKFLDCKSHIVKHPEFIYGTVVRIARTSLL